MNNYNQKPTLTKAFTHWVKRSYLLLLCGLLLAACGGGEATAVPDTPTPEPTNTATAVPPTNTPIPPTATPEPSPTPSPTPDITANFETYSDEAGRVTFQYPPDWELDVREMAKDALGFILTSGEDALDLLGADDFSQPLGFAIGEIRWVAFFGSDDPGLILVDWVQEMMLAMTPIGEMTVWEEDGAQFASQDYEVISGSDSLLLTVTVIVNGGRYGTFAYGTTAVGVDDYAPIAAAIIDSTTVPFVDPSVEPPDQTAAPATPPAYQFEGEMALVTIENGHYQMGRLQLATGEITDIVDQAANPDWRPGTDDLSYTTCDGDLCRIRLTSRKNALVSDDEVSFRYGSWSPDGRYLAFVANPDGVNDIYVYDFGVDPPGLTRLTENSSYNTVPIWSSEGQAIIFASDRDGDYDLYLMGTDGRNPVPMTQNDALDFAPDLSPDGTQVVYLSEVNSVLELFIFDFVRNENWQLTSNSPHSNFSPTWSPDGRTIAYLAQTDDKQYQLTFIPADGGASIPYPLMPPGPLFEIVWRPAPREFAVEVVMVDFTDPNSVLRAVFTSARLEDFSQLAGLCDPQGENDDDTAAICAITADHKNAASFLEWFASGQITGEPVINGDRAEIPFTFGPNGDREETMTLIRRDGRWYLFGF